MKSQKITALLSSILLTAGCISSGAANAAGTFKGGDINMDGQTDITDVILLKSILLYQENTEVTADVNRDGAVNTSDYIMLENYFMGTVNELPDIVVKDNTENQNPSVSASSYMEKIRSEMVTPEPSDISQEKPGVDYGTVEQITYMSTTAGREKRANVILPGGYSTDKKYPVMYINHGIFGSQDSMLDPSMGIRTISANLAAAGEAEQMIIVLTDMFSSSTMMFPGGYDVPTVEGYDAFVDDIANDLIPYIEEHYSAKTGRENRAITGFSMGGREALYIGISRPDLFGYIGGACPAPGITPTVDANMTHPGSMQESEFKIKDSDPKPYVLMISGARFDGVVGTHPQQYHELLTKNGTDHIWQEVPNGGHDGVTVRAHFYNFAKAAFRAQ